MDSPTESRRSSPPEIMTSKAQLSMCCSDMSKKNHSFDGTGDLKRESDTSSSLESSYQTTQPFNPSVSVTMSKDNDYGLPQTAQRLRIDFTPTDEDTEFVKKKCCDFWEFIHSRKDLKWMMVSPAPDKYPFQDENRTETSSTPVTTETTIRKNTKSIPTEKTALSVLQLAEKRGMVEEALEVKMCDSACAIRSVVSSDSADTKPVQYETTQRRASMKTSSLQVHAKKEKSRSKVTALCEELDKWDSLHPKSMEPPSQVPRLSYTVLQ